MLLLIRLNRKPVCPSPREEGWRTAIWKQTTQVIHPTALTITDTDTTDWGVCVPGTYTFRLKCEECEAWSFYFFVRRPKFCWYSNNRTRTGVIELELFFRLVVCSFGLCASEPKNRCSLVQRWWINGVSCTFPIPYMVQSSCERKWSRLVCLALHVDELFNFWIVYYTHCSALVWREHSPVRGVLSQLNSHFCKTTLSERQLTIASTPQIITIIHRKHGCTNETSASSSQQTTQRCRSAAKPSTWQES